MSNFDSEMQIDALKEILNIGIGKASAALSDIVNEPVLMSIPDVKILLESEAIEYMKSNFGEQLTCCVSEQMRGDLCGEALLFFHENNSLELVRLLLQNDSSPLGELTELEQDALMEIGNIVLNAALSSIANMVEASIQTHLPQFYHDSIDRIVSKKSQTAQNAKVVILHIDTRLKDRDIDGHILLLLEINSLRQINKYIDKLLGGF